MALKSLESDRCEAGDFDHTTNKVKAASDKNVDGFLLLTDDVDGVLNGW